MSTWIPTSLPPAEGQHIDIYVPENIPSMASGPGRIADCWFEDGCFMIDGDPMMGEDAAAISHWMPIPDPPPLSRGKRS